MNFALDPRCRRTGASGPRFGAEKCAQTDPETGLTDGLLVRATRSGTVPKFFYLLSDSEYFNPPGRSCTPT